MKEIKYDKQRGEKQQEKKKWVFLLSLQKLTEENNKP